MSRRTLACAFLAVAFCAACRTETEERRRGADAAVPPTPRAEVADDAGRRLAFDDPPRRVVSLVPSVTDLILALGGGERLVARTAYDTASSIRHLPSVGRGLTPSLEWVAGLRPDLVVAWPDGRSRSVVQRIEELGVPVYAARIETIADALATIRRFGLLLDLAAQAAPLAAAIEADLDAVAAAVDGRSRPTLFYAIALDPPMTVGSGTFIDELIGYAGARNVFADARGWPAVSMEEVVRRRPDIVLLAASPADMTSRRSLDRLRAAPGWRDLPAVRQGRVYGVEPSLFNRPGPGLGEVARHLAELIHPEAFAQGRGQP